MESMSADDVHGASEVAEPAVPGTYGIHPSGYRLPDEAHVGQVRLQVADLARSIRYYTQVLGLRVVAQDDGAARLAPHDDARVLVELRERPGAIPAARRAHLGLFHFAILLPDRGSLGRFVRHLSEIGERAGAGDHLVSEAFYLTDPDGLGIEVYADRPRATWMRVGRELVMATDPVDVRGLVRDAGDAPWTGMPAGTVMGHVHLHVGDIATADAFFAEAVGFDRTTRRYPGALFLSAGGYHHHLGTNIWAGPSAAPPQPDDAQLLAWTLEVPDASDVDRIGASLAAAGFAASQEDGVLTTRDPWGTALEIRAGA